MAEKRFLVAVIEFDASRLTAGSGLSYADVPHAIGACVDGLSDNGVFDTRVVYLLESAERTRIQQLLEHYGLPYPELIDDQAPLATVIRIQDHSRLPVGPG